MNSRFLFIVLSFLFVLASLSSPALGQDAGFPVCEMTDSAMTVATSLSSIVHLFGSNTSAYPHEFALATSYPVFDKVFDFYLSDHVSGRWSTGEFQTLISSILDNDSTLTDDVFGKDWSYFLRSGVDGNAYHAGVRFVADGTTYTKIKLILYATNDLPSPCTDGFGYACKGYSFYENGSNEITINATWSNSMDTVLGLGIVHELQHLIYYINGYPEQYYSTNETLSTLAEYFMNAWRDHIYDLAYDSSFMRLEPCDFTSKYDIERIWISYLYEVFKGNPTDPTDDLVYRWIHSAVSPTTRMTLSGLAAELWESDYDWLGGANPAERLRKVYANFLVAKFCNAPAFGDHGEFGLGGLNTVRDFALFLDNCDDYFGTPLSPVDCPQNPDPEAGHLGCWNVRVLVPEYTLGNSSENDLTLVNGIYEDGDASGVSGDGSTDYVDVAMMGTDYVVFRAGAYYDDDGEHELELRIGGNAKSKIPPFASRNSMSPVGWVIGYSENDDTLQVHPEHILFIEPVTFTPDSTASDTLLARPVIVADFGRSVKAVVLAIGACIRDLSVEYPINSFFYEYDYGVYTPGASTRTWEGDVYALSDVSVPDGGTLEVSPGTHVKIFDSDLAGLGADSLRVEINVDGALNLSGTLAEPVIVEPWSQVTNEEWAGIYFSDDSDGGTFDYCSLGYADIGIDSYAPISFNHATLHGASDALIRVTDSTLDINVTELSVSDGDGIVLDGAAATIDSTEVSDCGGYGLHQSGSGALNISHGNIHDNDVGVYVGSNATNGTISETRFEDNGIAISYYASTKPAIDECVITGNTTGIRLDHNSSPTVLHCMDTASYDGDISNNGSGFYCTDGSDPVVGYCDIHNNNTGVGAFDGSTPDFEGNGANKFRTHSSYHIANLDTGVQIPAEENYWSTNTGAPDYYPRSDKVLGDVDYTNALSGSPNPSSPGPGNDPTADPKQIATALGRAHPNPFNPQIQVPFSLKAGSDVQIAVYDVAGRLVRTLVHEHRAAGEYSIVWDGTSDKGTRVGSAVYFVRMVAGNYTETQKIVLLK